MIPPSIFVRITGSWPGCLLLTAAGLWYAFSGFQNNLLLQLVLGVALLTVAIRSRSRVIAYKRFEANWRRVGGIATPTRKVNTKKIIFGTVILTMGALAIVMNWISGDHNGPLPDVVMFAWLVVIAGLSAALFALFSTLGRRLRLRSKAHKEGVKTFEGKALPSDIVQPTLGVPRNSPGWAAFTSAIPEYCRPLIGVTTRGLIEEPKDAIVDVEHLPQNQTKRPGPKSRPARRRLVLVGSVLLVAVACTIAIVFDNTNKLSMFEVLARWAFYLRT